MWQAWQFDKWNNNSAQKIRKFAVQIEKLQWKQCFAASTSFSLRVASNKFSSSGTPYSACHSFFSNFILAVIFAGVSLANFCTSWHARLFCLHFSFDFFVHIALPSALHCWHCCDFRVSAFPQNVARVIFSIFHCFFCVLFGILIAIFAVFVA